MKFENILKVSLVLVLVLLLVPGWTAEVQEKKVKNTKQENSDEKSVAKRGILGGGYFGFRNAAPFPGFLQPRIPAAFAAGPHLLGQTAISAPPFHLKPGGAVVASYNVNYPQFPYIGQKAYAARPPFSFGGNQIIPGAFPSPLPFPSGTFAYPHPIPAIPPPAVAAFPPPVAAFPPPAIAAFPPPTFAFPPVQAVPAKPIFSLPPAFPANFFVNYPQPIFPVGIPAASHPIPTTFSTPTVATPPVQPWRPILLNPPTTVGTPSIQPPPISLLPPYGAPAPPEKENSIQQGYLAPSKFTIQEIAQPQQGHHYHQQQVNNAIQNGEYLPPAQFQNHRVYQSRRR